MFRWYTGSSITFVHMSDVWFSDLLDRNDPDASIWQTGPKGAMRLKSRAYVRLASSSWFTRGWTLQELLAPKSEVIFVTRNWKRFATKNELLDDLQEITGIERRYLARPELIQNASIAQRMSWASRRVTTREEDAAYCLLGIFDVNMPLLYGEGKKAFMRLQLEIIKFKSDESIFAWKNTSTNVSAPYGLLAPEPTVFAHSGRVVNFHLESRLPFSMTNQGLELRIPAGQAPVPGKHGPQRHNDYAAVNIQIPKNVPSRPFQLACGYFSAGSKTQAEREVEARRMPIELQLRKIGSHWQRVQCDRLDISGRSFKIDGAAFSLYYVRQPGLQSWMWDSSAIVQPH